MENVKSIVKSIIGKDMKNYGFKAYSNMYYCHIGGVIKGFKIYSNNLHYTIRFGCYPLCSGIKRDGGFLKTTKSPICFRNTVTYFYMSYRGVRP